MRSGVSTSMGMGVWDGERRGPRLSRLVRPAIIAVLLYVAWAAGRPYLHHYELQDTMLDVCRLPKGTNPDERILDRLMKEVRELGLESFIDRSSFRVTTGDFSRRITLQYDREVRFFPGIARRIHFRIEQDQPLPSTPPARVDDLPVDRP